MKYFSFFKINFHKYQLIPENLKSNKKKDT